MPSKVSDASVLGDFSHWLAELAKTSCRHHFTDHCNLNHVFHCSIWTFTLRNGFKRCSALHLFLLNFLGQPLSCHVGLVLLEGLIWCYHLQVTPNPPSPSEGKRGACNAAKRGHYHGFTYMAFFKRLSFNHHIVNRTCQNHSKSTHENWWTMKTTHQPFGRRFVSCQDAEG